MSTESRKSEASTIESHSHAWKLVGAFAIVYIIWGSTYLGIRYAIETIPPFLMAGSRNLVAGLLLFAFARRQKGGGPLAIHWRDAAIAGGLMLTIGNGGVTWAERLIPSGVTALIVALTPVWMVLFDWLRPKGMRPGALVFLGLMVGFCGVAVLARGNDHNSGSNYTWGVVALLASSMGWALGSVFNRSARKPASPSLAVGMQMISAGVMLLAFSFLQGELKSFSFARVSLLSFGAWLYLMIAGSLVAYSAYHWLLHATSVARVSTTAYVNPLIAVLLGCTIGHEPLSHELFVAGGLIILSVVMIVRSKMRPSVTTAPQPELSESEKC